VKQVFTDWEDMDGVLCRKITQVYVKTGEVCDGTFPVNDGITFMRPIVNTLAAKIHQKRIKEPSSLAGDKNGTKKPFMNP